MNSALGSRGSFTLASLWEDSWDRVAGSKPTFLAMLLTSLAVAAASGIALSLLVSVLTGGDMMAGGGLLTIIFDLGALVRVLVSPLIAGLLVAGLYRARGEAIHYRLLFENRSFWPKVMLITALFAVAEWLLAWVLPSPLIGPVTFFTNQLLLLAMLFVLDRDFSISESVAGALGIVGSNTVQYLLFLLMVAVMTFLGGVTFGIAFYWILPFLSICTAFVYIRGSGDQG